jgi:hypothetical protein
MASVEFIRVRVLRKNFRFLSPGSQASVGCDFSSKGDGHARAGWEDRSNHGFKNTSLQTANEVPQYCNLDVSTRGRARCQSASGGHGDCEGAHSCYTGVYHPFSVMMWLHRRQTGRGNSSGFVILNILAQYISWHCYPELRSGIYLMYLLCTLPVRVFEHRPGLRGCSQRPVTHEVEEGVT